jgi:GT2 family glycosyltransferase
VSDLPAISVIVPVRNGGARLGRLVASLLAQHYPGPAPQIVVVDNGSTDGAAEALRDRPITLLCEPRPGAPCARNTGARAATGDLLVFTDHDALADRRWLARLAAAFADPDVPAAAGETLPAPTTTPAARYLALIRHNSAEMTLRRPVFPFAATVNLAVRRSVYDAVGGFDETLPITDDADFSLRVLRTTGRPIRFVPGAIVFHDERTTGRALYRRYREYGEGWARLVAKHPNEVRWTPLRAVAADLDVVRAALLVPVGAARRLVTRDPMDLWYRWFEFVKRLAHREGFRAGARRLGRWFW